MRNLTGLIYATYQRGSPVKLFSQKYWLDTASSKVSNSKKSVRSFSYRLIGRNTLILWRRNNDMNCGAKYDEQRAQPRKSSGISLEKSRTSMTKSAISY